MRHKGAFPLKTFYLAGFSYIVYLYIGAFVLTYFERRIKFVEALFTCHSMFVTLGWGVLVAPFRDVTLTFMFGYVILGMPLLWLFTGLCLDGLARLTEDIRKKMIDEDTGPSLFVMVLILFVYIVLGAIILMLLSGSEHWNFRRAVYFAVYNSLSVGYKHAKPPKNWLLIFYFLYTMVGSVQIVNILQYFHLRLCNLIYSWAGERKPSLKG